MKTINYDFSILKTTIYFRSREGGGSTSYFRSTACTLLELWGPNDGGFCALATCPALPCSALARYCRSEFALSFRGRLLCLSACGRAIYFEFFTYTYQKQAQNQTTSLPLKKKASRSILTSFAMLTLLKMLTKLCCENPGAI